MAKKKNKLKIGENQRFGVVPQTEPQQGALLPINRTKGFDDLGREDARLIREANQQFPRMIDQVPATTDVELLKEVMERQERLNREAQKQLQHLRQDFVQSVVQVKEELNKPQPSTEQVNTYSRKAERSLIKLDAEIKDRISALGIDPVTGEFNPNNVTNSMVNNEADARELEAVERENLQRIETRNRELDELVDRFTDENGRVRKVDPSDRQPYKGKRNSLIEFVLDTQRGTNSNRRVPYDINVASGDITEGLTGSKTKYLGEQRPGGSMTSALDPIREAGFYRVSNQPRPDQIIDNPDYKPGEPPLQRLGKRVDDFAQSAGKKVVDALDTLGSRVDQAVGAQDVQPPKQRQPVADPPITEVPQTADVDAARQLFDNRKVSSSDALTFDQLSPEQQQTMVDTYRKNGMLDTSPVQSSPVPDTPTASPTVAKNGGIRLDLKSLMADAMRPRTGRSKFGTGRRGALAEVAVEIAAETLVQPASDFIFDHTIRHGISAMLGREIPTAKRLREIEAETEKYKKQVEIADALRATQRQGGRNLMAQPIDPSEAPPAPVLPPPPSQQQTGSSSRASETYLGDTSSYTEPAPIAPRSETPFRTPPPVATSTSSGSIKLDFSQSQVPASTPAVQPIAPAPSKEQQIRDEYDRLRNSGRIEEAEEYGKRMHKELFPQLY